MFTKVSNATILYVGDKTVGRVAARKTLGSFDYDDRGEGYLYVSVRACSADVPNLNYDMLPDSELKTAYKTFIGSPVYVNHSNSNVDRARGFIIDATYHDEDPNDKWIEILMEMDEETFPKLCHYIRTGEIDTVSMGLNCQSTTCSVCGNVAESPVDFCNHIKGKGLTYDGKLAYEICNGIEFFEESWVYDPADPTAMVQAIEDEGIEDKKDFDRVAHIKQAQDDETYYMFSIVKEEHAYDGSVIGNEAVSSYELGYEESYETKEEAIEDAEYAIDDKLRYSDDLYYECGPLKAVKTKLSAAIDEISAYDDMALNTDTIEHEYEYEDEFLYRSAYEATESLAQYVSSGSPSGNQIIFSEAQDSWETFYIEWPELDLTDEQEDALFEYDTKPYCKIRVSGHDPSDNRYAEPTGYVDLNDMGSFSDVLREVENLYEEWQVEVEESFDTTIDRVAKMATTRTERVKQADNMVNKRRIPEEVDMQNTDRVCPICGSPDFDGQYCDVCEYVEYADGFGDIDTEKAKDNGEERDEVSTDEDVEDVQDRADAKDDLEEQERQKEKSGRMFEAEYLGDFIDSVSHRGYVEGIDYSFVENRNCASVRSASLANLLVANGIKER